MPFINDRPMRKQTFTLLVFLLFTEAPVFAQLTTPNDHGITIGHIHLLSRDPDAQKRIWIEGLGAQPTRTGTLDMLRLPGVFIIINKAERRFGGFDGGPFRPFRERPE